jgi:tripartite-type tricarboxylate transporter receptor subunit TctC
MLDNVSAVRQHIASGRLKALAVSTRERSAQLPDVPSVIESGVADFEAGSWMAMFAPAATPAPVVDKLRTLLDPLVRSKEFSARIESTGGVAMPIAGDRQNAFMFAEIERWDRLIKQAGIQID